MKRYLNDDWKIIFKDELKSDYFSKLAKFIENEYAEKIIFPLKNSIFRALNETAFNKVKVVILGQDPYHNKGQAHGLAFSVPDGIVPPPSLKNIFKEILSDTGIEKNMNLGNLQSWSEQGVLLLNTVLTVEQNLPASHRNKGWEEFTNAIIQKISQDKNHCVFILWGNDAQKKKSLIDKSKHLVLESTHPSPLSAYRGFFGNKHFSKTNNYLKKYHKKEIQW